MNENANYKDRLWVLELRREAQRELVEWTCKQCEKQVRAGRLFMLENPEKSRFWEEDAVRRLA